MKLSLSSKIKLLVFTAVLVVAVAICAVSSLIFKKELSGFAHTEILSAYSGVQKHLTELQDSASGYAAFIASRPDLIDALASGDVKKVTALAKNSMAWLGTNFVVITDGSGTVVARGQNSNKGDGILKRSCVAQALDGVGVTGFEVDGETPFSLSASFPVYRNGKIIGAAIVGFDLSTEGFVDSVKNNYASDCAIFVADSCVSSTIVVDGKRSTGMKLADAKILEGLRGVKAEYVGYATIGKKSWDTAYWPVADLDGKTVGTFSVAKDLGLIEKVLSDLFLWSLIITVVIGLSIILVSSLYIRRLLLPIRRTTLMLKDISEGSGDLTKRLAVTTTDEIGTMSSYFNKTLDTVKDLIVEINRQAVTLADIGGDLASNMEETASSVHQIRANIDSVKNQTHNQAASVTETNSAVGQIRKNIENLNDFVGQQSRHVAQSSSAIEQMLANIASVTASLVHNAKNVQELADASTKGKDDLANVAEVVHEISKDSESLIEISGIIESVASQTNLLAMNAAIEAAHAGNAGKGFAVVADEIRTLAESSSTQSKTISSVLLTIKKSIDRISDASDVVQRQFVEIDARIKKMSELEDSIRRAMEEQGTGSKEVLESIGRLNDITSLVRKSSDEMLSGSNEVSTESANLGRITDEVSGSMTEMASGIGQITAAMQEVNRITQSNKDSIDALNREVGKFKVV